MTPLPSIRLLAEGAVLLTDLSLLVVADVHLGKSAAFRARGLPVPEGDNARDFQRLLDLSCKYHAAGLIIAGDLFHAPSGITPELKIALGEFLDEIQIPVTLVVGNHDRKIPTLPSALRQLSHLDLGDKVRVIHDPAHADGDRLHLSGHLHPVVKIPDGKRTSLRLPCFLLRGNTLVMPAFGSFTGGAIVKPESGDRIFVTLRDQVIELPSALIG
jgi:DNA ligase-associated metallophosphoesterase